MTKQEQVEKMLGSQIKVLKQRLNNKYVEIERLKEKNNELNKENWSLEEELKKKELEITYARNNGYEKGYDECEEYTKGKIKQAKIDILRELKERLDSAPNGWAYTTYIDELIEEVENEQKD